MRFSFIVKSLLVLPFAAIAGCFNFYPTPVSPTPVASAIPEVRHKIMDNSRISVTTIAEGKTNRVGLLGPTGITVGAQGDPYVTDITSRLLRIDSSGVFYELAGKAVKEPWRPWEGGYVDGIGMDARFNGPDGLVVDASGDIIVADSGNQRLRKVTPDGRVTTLAGSGVTGAQGGVALAAQFNLPNNLAMDESGSLLVSEWAGNRIRRIDPDGTVTTIAGTGEAGYADGPALHAKFDSPEGLAVGRDGSVYVLDSQNHRLRRIFGGMVTTVAGDGPKGFNDGPALKANISGAIGLVSTRGGDLIFFDGQYNCIRRVSASGQVTTIVGGGVLNPQLPRIGFEDFDFGESGHVDGDQTTTRFRVPGAIAIDSSENIYVCDYSNDTIRNITFLR